MFTVTAGLVCLRLGRGWFSAVRRATGIQSAHRIAAEHAHPKRPVSCGRDARQHGAAPVALLFARVTEQHELHCHLRALTMAGGAEPSRNSVVHFCRVLRSSICTRASRSAELSLITGLGQVRLVLPHFDCFPQLLQSGRVLHVLQHRRHAEAGELSAVSALPSTTYATLALSSALAAAAASRSRSTDSNSRSRRFCDAKASARTAEATQDRPAALCATQCRRAAWRSPSRAREAASAAAVRKAVQREHAQKCRSCTGMSRCWRA